MSNFQYNEQDLENIRKYGMSCRFDFPYVLYRMKLLNIDYASLYDVRIGETDFSGAIKRSLKHGPLHLTKEYINAILS